MHSKFEISKSYAIGSIAEQMLFSQGHYIRALCFKSSHAWACSEIERDRSKSIVTSISFPSQMRLEGNTPLDESGNAIDQSHYDITHKGVFHQETYTSILYKGVLIHRGGMPVFNQMASQLSSHNCTIID